ncbi:ATP-binding protein [Algiphilus sp.]|uniref:ATP-binding protein n=1 Tax=Algiphilus sp. TaxID=1872431 RepID=UPI0025BFFA11|nr:ATP-binding protein [Algiphilus sp.]MCK5768877.1 GHKL domain-containing protein [Algiphilus sp.]
MPFIPTSLRSRLIVGALAVLATFLTAAGIGQERAFRAAALSAEQDKSRGLVFALLGATEPSARGGLVIGDFDLPDPRLTQPESGLAAWLLTRDGQVVWRSPSALHAPPDHGLGDVGEFRFEETEDHFLTSYHLRWIGTDAEARHYRLLVETTKTPFREQLSTYRRQLLGWLLAAAAGLLLSLTVVLGWLITPVRRMERELRAVERGDSGEISGQYPDELQPLAVALNAMVQSERSQQQRYRNALGDLAHSLKTPLAVLDGMLREGTTDAARTREQVDRMRRITEHQLARASHAGRRALAEPVELAPLIGKISSSLSKVYVDRGTDIAQTIEPNLRARADEGDLYELFGNVLDNACKWCEGRVRLTVARDGSMIVITVEDDGPGFPEDADAMLRRGQRADERKPGQGLGLASVKDLVELYEGTIVIDRSRDLGGARLVVRIRA